MQMKRTTHFQLLSVDTLGHTGNSESWTAAAAMSAFHTEGLPLGNFGVLAHGHTSGLSNTG